jgi:magnesium transporter
LSLGLFAFSMVTSGNSRIAMVLGLSLYAAIGTSLITGLLVPYLFRGIKLDPANASGPIATIIQDIFSVAVYFVVASWLL